MSIPPLPNGSHHAQTDPAIDRYQPARETLEANTFVNDPRLSDLDRIYLQGIQGTWKLKQEHWADRGYTFSLMCIWDQDRIWGAFDLGFYKGILMVEHGPHREPPEFSAEDEDSDTDNDVMEDDDAEDDERDPIYYDFTWRGTCSQIPDTAINNPLITKGKIEFGTTWISGYFEGMGGIGLPGGRCDFDCQNVFGPRRVPRDLQSFVDDWNDLNYFGEDETVRQVPSSGVGTILE
ncbi:hypothetical protein AB5N19_01467 [Seiridium cardinale]